MRQLPDEEVVRNLRWLNIAWVVEKLPPLGVRTWCHYCGSSSGIILPNHYTLAMEFLWQMDDYPMHHYNHFEEGMWGMLLQFDEVLDVAFPEERALDDHLSPMFGEYDPYQYTFEEQDIPKPILLPSPEFLTEAFVLDFFYDPVRYLFKPD